MINDPIVEAVRETRMKILEKHGSARAYFQDIIARQSRYGDRLVSLPPKKISRKQTA